MVRRIKSLDDVDPSTPPPSSKSKLKRLKSLDGVTTTPKQQPRLKQRLDVTVKPGTRTLSPKRSYLDKKGALTKEQVERRTFLKSSFNDDDPLAEEDIIYIPPPVSPMTPTTTPKEKLRLKKRISRSLSPKRLAKSLHLSHHKKASEKVKEKEPHWSDLKSKHASSKSKSGAAAADHQHPPPPPPLQTKSDAQAHSHHRPKLIRKLSFTKKSKPRMSKSSDQLDIMRKSVMQSKQQQQQNDCDNDDPDEPLPLKAKSDGDIYSRAARRVLQRRVERSKTDNQDLEDMRKALIQKTNNTNEDDSDDDGESSPRFSLFAGGAFAGPGFIQRGLQALEQLYDDNYTAPIMCADDDC
jgi:hypothetical protein